MKTGTESLSPNSSASLNKRLAKRIIESSAYTLAEIKADFNSAMSPSYKQGFWASRGIDWKLGRFIEKTLLS